MKCTLNSIENPCEVFVPALQCLQLDSGSRTAFELAQAGVPVETSAAQELPLIYTAAMRSWPLLAVMLLTAPASELPQVWASL